MNELTQELLGNEPLAELAALQAESDIRNEIQQPMQELLGLDGPVHFNDTRPVRLLTIIKGADRYQLRRSRRQQRPLDYGYGYDAIYEVVKLGMIGYPVRVGWLAWRERPNLQGMLMGWFFINASHPSFTLVMPVQRDGVWCQSLWDGLDEILTNL